MTQSDIRLRETRRTILSKVVSAVQKVQRLYNRMRMTKYALLPGESASRHELSWMRGCSVDVRTDCQGQRLGAYQREVGHRVGRTGDSDDVFLACVGEGSGQSSHPVSIELRMNQPSFQAIRSVAGSATPAPSRAHFSTAKVTGSRRWHFSCQCMHTAHFCVLRASHPNPAAALAEHLQRQHERLAHAQVKATMAPGPVAARRFASTYLYPGAWSAVSTLDMLSACPPNATHTGPDGPAPCPAHGRRRRRVHRLLRLARPQFTLWSRSLRTDESRHGAPHDQPRARDSHLRPRPCAHERGGGRG